MEKSDVLKDYANLSKNINRNIIIFPNCFVYLWQ